MSIFRAWPVLVVLVMLCQPVRADHPPDLETARRRIRHAEAHLAEAVRRVQEARYELTHVQHDHAQIVQGCDRARTDLAAAERALSDARRAIPLMGADADNLTRRLATLESQLAAAREAQAEASAQLDQVREAALDELHAEAGYQRLAAERQAALAELDHATAESLEALTESQQFQIAEKVLNEAEARVESLRRAGPSAQQALAAASQAWMDRQNELNRLKENWLKMDNEVGAARHRLETVQAALQAMDEQIERRLAVRPEVMSAESVVADVRSRAESIEQELDRTAQARLAAESELDRLHHIVGQAGHDVEHLRREVNRLGPAVHATAASVTAARDALARASDAEHHARHALADARRDLAEAEHREEQVRERERREESRHRDRPDQKDSQDHDHEEDRGDGPRRGKRFRQ